MRKFDLTKLKLLPAVLGWVLAVLFLAFASSMMFSNPSHAAENVNDPAVYAPTCTQHKNFLGLDDGWDCKVPAASTTLTMTTDPGAVWCDQGTTLCKSTGRATLRINKDALAALGKPRKFEIAMTCTTTPGSADASCKFAVEGEAAK